MMNTLIDVDPDPATDELAFLTHLHPHCGFQYRNSYTYWTAASIVGKVLAPTCRAALGGWVGPARPTADLGRSQIARVRGRRPRRRGPSSRDVLAMAERAGPLGPAAEVFPVREYALVLPDLDDDVVDTVRIELLGFRPCKDRASERRGSGASAGGSLGGSTGLSSVPPPSDAAGGPRWFDASVQFAIDGVSWPLRLAYDVDFVTAWPCSDGPHPLFVDYVYTRVKADEVIRVRDWGGFYAAADRAQALKAQQQQQSRSGSLSPAAGGAAAGAASGSRAAPVSSPAPVAPVAAGAAPVLTPSEIQEEEEKVLVVESFGVADNEVLARAWCAHWGLSAIVADIRKTWYVPPPFLLWATRLVMVAWTARLGLMLWLTLLQYGLCYSAGLCGLADGCYHD